MTEELGARLEQFFTSEGVDVSGIGGTLAGNALSMAAVRATLSNALRQEDFAVAIPLAERWAEGVASVIRDHSLPWTVQRLGCRAEYWFCEPPRNGAQAAAASDQDLEAWFHLYMLNRGILLTPFHNMALMSPYHVRADVDRHTEVFAEAVSLILAP
jgi:glutamate-1-semialdehyde 2,1-aminomutase